MPFKVIKIIKVGINRKPICDFLLVISSNWHAISHCFRVTTAYCSNFGHLVFLSLTLGGGAQEQRTTFILGSLEST